MLCELSLKSLLSLSLHHTQLRRNLKWCLELHNKTIADEEERERAKKAKMDTEGQLPTERINKKQPSFSKVDTKMGINLHLQENQIGDEGVAILISFLKKVEDKVALKRLYLYKNVVGDEGANAIAKYLQESKSPVFEIHLSHNRLTIKGITSVPCPPSLSVRTDLPRILGACALFLATKQATACGGYSTSNRSLWLRLEWNYISYKKAEEFLSAQGFCFIFSSFSIT